MRLKDKVAIITGSGSGIGRETAFVFAREGAKVAVFDYNEAAGRATAEEICQSGGESEFFLVDVADRAGVDAAVQRVVERWGRIDVLINNAGITADARLEKMTEEQFDRVIAINLKGVFNCTQAVLPTMLAQGKGKIVSASSVVGLYGNFGQTNYAATKFGVIGMTKTWAKELGRKGINVNAVAPGFVMTDMVAKMPEKVLDAMREKTPIGRLGTPHDIALAYVYLASDESDFVHGTVLSIDGGVVL